MECPTCSYTVSPYEVVTSACPVCGTDYPPERDQPGGTKGDFQALNMKEPGYGQDMGGNPLQEGILGDWQNRNVRDESFASVQAMKKNAHAFQVEHTPTRMVHNGNHGALAFFGAHVNGIPAHQSDVTDYWKAGINKSPEPWNVEVEHPEYEPAVRALLQHGAVVRGTQGLGPARDEVLPVIQRIQAGELPLPSHHGEGVTVTSSNLETWQNERMFVDQAWDRQADYGDTEAFFTAVVASMERESFAFLAPVAMAGLRAAAPTIARGAAGAGGKLLPKALQGLKGAAPGLAKGVGKHMVFNQIAQGIGGALGLGGGAAAGGAAAPQQILERGPEAVSHVVAAPLETPDSITSLGDSGDPEKVDPHESPEHPNAYENEVNDIGGTSSFPEEAFDSFVDALPELLEYYEREESGLENPKIRELIEFLDQHPEWDKDAQDDLAPDHFEKLVPKAARVSYGPALGQPALPAGGTGLPAPQQVAPNPTAPQPASPVVGATCPECNAALTADGSCPNGHLGGPNQQVQAPQPALPPTQPNLPVQPATGYRPAKVAINDHQGPRNAEQFSVVAELLMEQGREAEIPGMLAAPWEYAEELAEVQQKLNKPPIDQSQPQQPTQESAPPGDTMPVPGMEGPGGPGAGGGQLPPGMSSIRRAFAKVGADAYTPRCPECNSATTGVESADGDCRCHACGNSWQAEGTEQKLGYGNPGDNFDPDEVYGRDYENFEPECPHCGADMFREYDQPANLDGSVTCRTCGESHGGDAHQQDIPTEDWIPHPANDSDWWDREPPRYQSAQKEHLKGVDSDKRQRQYEHIKESCLKSGKSEEECKELAARTVNKQRAEKGETKGSSAHEALTHEDLHADVVPEEAPEDHHKHEEDLDPNEKTWTTEDGETLRVGEEYELRSSKFSVPDLVRVDAIKPDAIDLTFIGEINDHGPGEDDGLAYRHEISKEEAQLQDYSFAPTAIGRQPDFEPQRDPGAPTFDTAPGETSDLSTPHEVNSKITEKEWEFIRSSKTNEERKERYEFVANYYTEDPTSPAYNPGVGTEGYRDQVRHNPNKKELRDIPERYHANPEAYYKKLMQGRPEDFAGFSGQPWGEGQAGRGLIDENGQVHTWNEEEGTHEQYAEQNGIQNFSGAFGVDPDGKVVPLGSNLGPDHIEAIKNHNPALQPPAGPAPDPNVFNFASAPDSHEREEVDPDLEWLRGGSTEPDVEAAAVTTDNEEVDAERAWLLDGQAPSPRTAGAKYTPAEQRDFIDEDGEARNKDKLQLGGTHYEARDAGRAEEAPDDHLIFGL